MLTKEILKSNIGSLTDEQITAIELLSKNDEDKVIGTKVREIHDAYDQDIASITGKQKPENTKSYVFLKDQLSELLEKSKSGEKAAELQKTIESVTAERDDMKKKIASGSTDEAVKAQLSSLEQKLKDKESEITTVRSAMETEKQRLSDQLADQVKQSAQLQLNHSIDSYLLEHKIKFKAGIPDSILQETIANRKAALVSKIQIDQVDDGKGGKVVVVRDEKGEIMRNPDNKLEPYSPGELFAKNVSDIIDPGQRQTGSGTNPPPGSGKSTTLDLSPARSQVKADQIIVNHILTNEGIAKTDPRFGERQKELRSEHKVSELPMREAGTE